MSGSSPLRQSAGQHARFMPYAHKEGQVLGLADDHPAILEKRTLFPGRVTAAAGSKHYLMSGHNNSKTGKMVLKGAWADMPIFTLTLEERRTCPASCAQWRSCYGNGMQWPARWDHTDPDFLDFLRAEIITKAREHPDGLVIRLHVLGDFFSFDYVRMWVEMIDRFPQLKVYGYTARREDADDEESRRIAAGLRRLSERVWDQFAIRFSRTEAGRQHAIVVDEEPNDPDVILCPQGKNSTAVCGTCGLCWSPHAQDKTIAFMRHGHRAGGHKRGRHAKPNAQGHMPSTERVLEVLLQLADDRGIVSRQVRDICDATGVSAVQWSRCRADLAKTGHLQVLQTGRGNRRSVVRVFAEAQGEYPPPLVLPLPPMKPKPVAMRDRIPQREARAAAPRRPDAPLVQKRFIPSATNAEGKVTRPWLMGTADRFDIGSADDRIDALPDDEKARIEKAYGAKFK